MTKEQFEKAIIREVMYKFNASLEEAKKEAVYIYNQFNKNINISEIRDLWVVGDSIKVLKEDKFITSYSYNLYVRFSGLLSFECYQPIVIEKKGGDLDD